MNSLKNDSTDIKIFDDKTISDCNANLPFMETVVFCCLHCVSALLALIGNLLVLASIYCTRQLWTKHSIFISSMAFADFLVGLLVGPLYISIAVLKVWFTQHALFKMENFLWIQTLAATTYSLCAISVDRYFAVKSAIKYHVVVTAQRCIIAVVFIWVNSLILSSLVFFMTTEDQTETLFFLSQVMDQNMGI